jgi:hypothetical protein
MRAKLRSTCLLIALVVMLLLPASPCSLGAIDLSLGVGLLGEPDVFVPGWGLSAEILLTRSLGVFAGGAYFISGTWDLAAGVSWHVTPRFALKLQALFLFDVIDGFVPQLGAGLRWSFPLTRSLMFFNELDLNVPLIARFLQPEYATGFTLTF